MSEPLHVAFVWHMHQPYYRSALTGAFDMPWARMHALKDYADMVTTLAAFPSLHQTFNLVPSLVEQLESYASGDFSDVYWNHTLKPASELDETERAFIVERMCERPDHPRARAFPRYLELARKRESLCAQGWAECARAFSLAEMRDLQVWFNLAWFDPVTLETEPLAGLVRRDRDFDEHDKLALAEVQAAVLASTLPAYREAARRGQIELTTSPYFHPILPLLASTDSARVGAPDTLLPPRRFAHPEDAREQIRMALDKHARVFGERPAGMWCSEQAVGEDVLTLLTEAGLRWTISDETVLAKSLAGAAPLDLATRPQTRLPAGCAEGAPLTAGDLYAPYRLEREGAEIAMVFRDHTLSDLIGFAYQSWNSRDAANDLLRRLRDIRDSPELRQRNAPSLGPSLVTIALDGENAWEYYPRDGRDFLKYLYEGLAADDSLRCVTVSEHLAGWPATRHLGWLHTGSWIGGDLRTWSGDRGHNVAWELLHAARDLAAARRSGTNQAFGGGLAGAGPVDPETTDSGTTSSGAEARPAGAASTVETEAIWWHILVAEGSDWYWWFGDHHHTELDYVWDLNFRLHLQAVYRGLGEQPPLELLFPILGPPAPAQPSEPQGGLAPSIDGLVTQPDEWQSAGFLQPDLRSTMQPSETTSIREARFGWMGSSLCMLLVPSEGAAFAGLDVQILLTRATALEELVLHFGLVDVGGVTVHSAESTALAGMPEVAWDEVLEVCLPLTAGHAQAAASAGVVIRVGRQGRTEHVFRATRLASV
jgi:alpha-amylase/alpha-mannosidase (GH57 family)